MAEPILNLTTLVERRTVRIDGKDYDLINPGEVSLLDFQRLSADSAKVDALVAKRDEEATESDVLELQALLDRLCKFVLRAPDEVHARLGDVHRLRIVQVFTDLQREAQAPAIAEGTAGLSTGVSSSPASSGSTAGRRASGSRRRRSQ